MKEPSKQQFKDLAKLLRQVLRDKHNIELKHGHSLEVCAKVFGYTDWNTASALSIEAKIETPTTNKQVESSESELPIATKLLTAGALADFFSKFDRETRVVVNEYKDSAMPDTNIQNSISDFLAGTTTSVCSLTYDSEIQNGAELRLELNTEEERKYQLQNFGKSSNQTFEKTEAGRSQRRIKYLYMQNSFWNPRIATSLTKKT